MSRWPILLLVLLASTFGLVACGDDGGGDDDPAAVLEETFGEGKEVKSGRLDVSLNVNAKGIEQLREPVTLALRGPFQSSGDEQLPKFDFEVDINSGGQRFTAGAVSTADKGFLRFQDQAYAVPDQLFKQFKDGYAEQAKCNEEQGDKGGNTTFKALGIDPRRWLSGAKNEGTEDVGGVETTHISSSIDVPKFLDDVNRVLGRTDLQSDPCADDKQAEQNKQPRGRQLTDAQRKQITESVKNARVDIWTGADDRILRRLNVALGIENEKKQTGDIKLDLTIGALNEEQEIKAPASSKPLEELLAQFGGEVPNIPGAGGAGGTGGAPSDGSAQGSGGTPAPAPTDEYTKCLQDAGQDVSKLQQCAELLGQ